MKDVLSRAGERSLGPARRSLARRAVVLNVASEGWSEWSTAHGNPLPGG